MERPEALQSAGRKRVRAAVDGLHPLYPLQLHKILRRIVKAAVDGVIEQNDLVVTLLGKLHIPAQERFVEPLEKSAAARGRRGHNAAGAAFERLEKERHICLDHARIALLFQLIGDALNGAGGVLDAENTAFLYNHRYLMVKLVLCSSPEQILISNGSDSRNRKRFCNEEIVLCDHFSVGADFSFYRYVT